MKLKSLWILCLVIVLCSCNPGNRGREDNPDEVKGTDEQNKEVDTQEWWPESFIFGELYPSMDGQITRIGMINEGTGEQVVLEDTEGIKTYLELINGLSFIQKTDKGGSDEGESETQESLNKSEFLITIYGDDNKSIAFKFGETLFVDNFRDKMTEEYSISPIYTMTAYEDLLELVNLEFGPIEIYGIEDSQHPLYGIEEGPIEDDNKLNYIYNEYIYDALTTIANEGSFDSVEDLHPAVLVDYARQKYMRANMDKINTEFVDYSEINHYVYKFFGDTEVNTSLLSSDIYIPESDQISLYWNVDETFHDYKSNNGWNIFMENCYMNEDYSISVDVIYYSWTNDQQIEKVYTINLMPRLDGSGDYFFASALAEFFTVETIQFEGNVVEVDMFSPYRDEAGRLQASIVKIAETEKYVYWTVSSYGYSQRYDIIAMSKRSKEIDYSYDLGLFSESSIELVESGNLGSTIRINFEDRTLILNEELKEIATVQLPEHIKELVVENVYDYSTGLYEQGFFGYDVSDDFTKYTYATEQGLFYYDTESDEELLILEAYTSPSKFGELQYIMNPKFIGTSHHILANLPGWEWSNGYVYYNSLTGESFVDDSGMDAGLPIQYEGQEFYLIYKYEESDSNGTYESKAYFLNLASGEISDAPEVFENIDFSGYESHNVGINIEGHGIIVSSFDYEKQFSSYRFLNSAYEFVDSTFECRMGNCNLIGVYEDQEGLHGLFDYSSSGNEFGTISWEIVSY